MIRIGVAMHPQLALRRLPLHLLCLCLLVSGCASQDIGDEIRDNYESSLSELPLSERQHFSLRMYRITGNDKYLPAIRADAIRDARSLSEDIDQLTDPAYRLMQAARIVQRYPDDTEKSRQRKALLAKSGELAFAKSLLYDVYQAEDLGLSGQPPLYDITPALEYLRQVDWAEFWLAPETLRIYAAQSANQIYYLHHLGIIDLRTQLEQAFRAVFPDASDDQLSADACKDQEQNAHNASKKITAQQMDVTQPDQQGKAFHGHRRRVR